MKKAIILAIGAFGLYYLATREEQNNTVTVPNPNPLPPGPPTPNVEPAPSGNYTVVNLANQTSVLVGPDQQPPFKF